MNANRLFLLLFFLLIICGCSLPAGNEYAAEQAKSKASEHDLDTIGLAVDQASELSDIGIVYPYQGTLFPADIAAPRFSWQDDSGAGNWFIRLQLRNVDPVETLVNNTTWMPDDALWERIKQASMSGGAKFEVWGIGDGQQPLSTGIMSFSTSPDRVEAPILYRQVPLPFSTTNFDKMRWCLGQVSSNSPPKIIMEKLPVCASCHLASKDGSTLSMEMNFSGDGGAQFITRVRPDITLNHKDFMSWNDFPRSGVLPKSRGLFGKMSPSSNYLIASVNEISLAIITRDLAFSQVFFPTYGILGVYSVNDRTIMPLPGADDFDYVHANPNWSPDEKFIVFCKTRTKNEVHEDISNVVPIQKEESVDELNSKYVMQFDLYRIPFAGGKGGDAIPIEGASKNGYSNYFPRYSPDGRWIVFTRSKTGIMLQPDSELYIIPAEGGTARRMNCNRRLFNSWHSWSPNGKWLLFSSKVNTPYTEIFITHISEDGTDTPPVLLSHLSSPTHAANVPEFVNFKYEALDRIKVAGQND